MEVETEIVEEVVAGEEAAEPREPIDLDGIEPGEEGELEGEFSENLAVLRQARETGVAVGGP